MRASRSLLFTLFVIGAGPRLASAQSAPKPTPAPPDRVEHWVDFRADRVELEPDAGALELKGAVVVTARRFRLTSEAVTLTRSSRGVHVDGSGRLALCACPHPPLTLGFAAADLAPPTDVLLQHATVRVGPVPIFYSPYLWLRSPDRAGLLPPSIGYRGEEGLWLASGFHRPLATGENGRRALDVGVGAYLKGGVRFDVVLAGVGGRTSVGFDWYRREALDVVSAHAATSGDTFFAERLDLLRGRRGVEAASEIDRAALPSDRLRVAVGNAGRSVFGVAIVGDSRRGQRLGELGVFGPSVTFGTGHGIGRYATYELSSGLASARSERGDLFAARAALELNSTLPLGMLSSELGARQRVELVQLPDASARDVRAELRARASLPLARRLATVTHTLEPFVEGALESGVRAEEGAESVLSDLTAPQRAALGSIGLDSALGGNKSRAAVELDVRAGLIATRDRSESVLGGSALADAGPARLSVHVRALPSRAATELSASIDARLAQNLALALRVDGDIGDVRAADGLWRSDFSRPAGSMLDRSGWSGRGRVRLPWGPGLFAEVGSDVDISEKRWLASSAALGYRHGCRCLSLIAAASRRVGRRGFDAGLNVEIVPR